MESSITTVWVSDFLTSTVHEAYTCQYVLSLGSSFCPQVHCIFFHGGLTSHSGFTHYRPPSTSCPGLPHECVLEWRWKHSLDGLITQLRLPHSGGGLPRFGLSQALGLWVMRASPLPFLDCFKMWVLILFRYGKANRWGDSCYWKRAASCTKFPRGRVLHATRGGPHGEAPGQSVGVWARAWVCLPGKEQMRQVGRFQMDQFD